MCGCLRVWLGYMLCRGALTDKVGVDARVAGLPGAVTHAQHGAHTGLRQVVVQAAEVVAERPDAGLADVIHVEVAPGGLDWRHGEVLRGRRSECRAAQQAGGIHATRALLARQVRTVQMVSASPHTKSHPRELHALTVKLQMG